MRQFLCKLILLLGPCLGGLFLGTVFLIRPVSAGSPTHLVQETEKGPPPIGLQSIGQIDGDYTAVMVSGTLAYLGGNNGLTIFDISQPTQPVTLTHLAMAQPIQDLKVVSNLLYLAQGVYDAFVYPVTGTVQIWDVQNPMSPVIRSSFPISPEAPVAIDVVGAYAYVGASYAGPFFQQSTLYVLDVRNPSLPMLTQRLAQSDASIGDIAHTDDGLYLARYVAGGLDILTLTAPATPSVKRHIVTEAQAVAALNQQLYVASSNHFGEPTGGFQGLQIFQVADPAAPVALGRFQIAQQPTSVAINQSHIYLASSNLLQVIDVTSPTIPSLLGATPLTGSPTTQGLQVQGDLVFVITRPTGLRILRTVELTGGKSFLPLITQ
ncbi:MAG: hypothetical protein R3E79_40170 [Caldilineaceae bacterium]